MPSGFTLPRAGTVFAAIAAAATLIVGTAGGAQASTYVNAGSNTHQNVTRALTSEYENNVDPEGSQWVSVDAGTPAGAVNINKAACANNYGAGHYAWPNGSSQGIDALLAERTGSNANCLSFARSSRGPKVGTNETSLTFVRVAGDAISWATKKPGAPTYLTQAQLQGIYNCTITNWNQIPGSAVSGTIQKHIPWVGSDLRRDFIDRVLGGVDPTATGNSACTTTIIQTAQENRGDAPQITSVDAIIPFSKAAYGEQTTPASGVVNHTNGFTLGGIDGKAPSVEGFVGNRSIYYVYDPLDSESDTSAIAFIDWAKAPAQQWIWNIFGFTP